MKHKHEKKDRNWWFLIILVEIIKAMVAVVLGIASAYIYDHWM